MCAPATLEPGTEVDVNAVASAVVEELLGSTERPAGAMIPVIDARVNDRVEKAMNSKIMEQVEAKVGELGLVDSINEIRDAVASRPPGPAATGQFYPAAPWAAQNVGDVLGLPDPNWYNPNAVGAKLDNEFESFPDFVRAVIRQDIAKVPDPRLINVTTGGDVSPQGGPQSALTGQEIQLGGALVPEQYRPQLLMLGLQPTSIRQRAMVLPMAAPTIQIPAIRDTSHAAGDVFGGIEFQWLEVNNPVGRSEPDFKLVELTARTLAGGIDIPNTLIEDSFISVPSLIYQLWQMGVPWMEEKYFIRGDGVAKPKGMLNSDAVVVAPRAADDQIGIADIAGMEARLLPSSRGRAVYMCHPAALEQIYQLSLGGVRAWMPSLSEGMPETLNGRPIIWNEHMSPRNLDGQIALVDWTYYVIGDRQALSMSASPHQKFDQHITVMKGIERIDGQTWLDEPITAAQNLVDNTTFDMSPFIVLDGD